MENDQYYFKSTHEMLNIFYEIPEAISNTNEVVNKIDAYKLKGRLIFLRLMCHNLLLTAEI